MRIIAFPNQKGGVGKTTSCVNLSICLAQRGKKVLVVDMDPQANATIHMGRDPNAVTWTSRSLLDSAHFDLDRAIYETAVGVDLIPANSKLLECNKTLLSEYGRETRLREKLEDYAENAALPVYDYVMIDCAPALDLICTNVLMACTDVIVPIQPRFFALKGFEHLSNMVGQVHRTLNPKFKVMGILVTMFDRTAALDRVMLDLLREKIEAEYGDYLFPAIIYKSVSIAESEKRLPVVLHDPDSPVSKAYHQNAEEILRR